VRAAVLLLGLIACQDRDEIVVFHAASLSRAFSELREAYLHRHPKARVRVEASGSQTAARKVSELGLRGDLVAAADARIIDEILIPEHAAWNLEFASNEIVLAHGNHSRYTSEVTAESWPEILRRADVVLGMVDPDLAPIGYRTLMVWQLAGALHGMEDLAGALRRRVAREHLLSDENELLALLSSRAVDYAFMYRSTTEDHHLKATRLPHAYNLGRPDTDYSHARVMVRMHHGRGPMELAGAPVVYGLAVPRSAPNPNGALRWIDLLLAEEGQRILTRAGLQPMVRSPQPGALPGPLRRQLP
jgi:molybdate/tungstate transport system substrate-binding protein